MNYSVIIPAFNCADTITDTVRSIRKSGLYDYEIIVINDGSTDQTADVLEQLMSQFPEVHSLSKPNGGVSSARNLGLRHAQGDYILFVDADDAVEENAFCHFTKIVEQQQPDMLIFGMQFDHYYKKTCYQTERMISPRTGLLSAEEIGSLLIPLYRCNYLTPIWNKFIRRDLIQNHQIQFEETMMLMEDCLFSLECLQNCRTVFLSDEVIYHYSLSETDRRAASRLRRAGNLYEYIGHFSGLRAEYAPIVRKIYYMLLCQRVRIDRTVAQLRAEAQDLEKSRFGADLTDAPAILKRLQAGQFLLLLCQNMKVGIRHRIAVLYKTLRHKCRRE